MTSTLTKSPTGMAGIAERRRRAMPQLRVLEHHLEVSAGNRISLGGEAPLNLFRRDVLIDDDHGWSPRWCSKLFMP
jgi:hypothetical protein